MSIEEAFDQLKDLLNTFDFYQPEHLALRIIGDFSEKMLTKNYAKAEQIADLVTKELGDDLEEKDN